MAKVKTETIEPTIEGVRNFLSELLLLLNKGAVHECRVITSKAVERLTKQLEQG